MDADSDGGIAFPMEVGPGAAVTGGELDLSNDGSYWLLTSVQIAEAQFDLAQYGRSIEGETIEATNARWTGHSIEVLAAHTMRYTA